MSNRQQTDYAMHAYFSIQLNTIPSSRRIGRSLCAVLAPINQTFDRRRHQKICYRKSPHKSIRNRPTFTCILQIISRVTSERLYILIGGPVMIGRTTLVDIEMNRRQAGSLLRKPTGGSLPPQWSPPIDS